jgi:hypothetical protein
MPKPIKNGDNWSSKNIYSKQTSNENMVQYVYGLSYQSKNRQRVNTVHICPTPGTGFPIRVITKLPNTEQSSKGKGKTHKSTNRQNQSTTGKLGKRNGPDLVQVIHDM